MLVAMKGFVLILLGVFLFCLVKAIRLGRQMSAGGQNAPLLEQHRTYVREAQLSLFVLIIALVSLETYPKVYAVPAWLLAVHLLFALLFLTLFLTMRYWKTGLRHAKTHAKLASILFVVGAGMLLTGLPMLYLL